MREKTVSHTVGKIVSLIAILVFSIFVISRAHAQTITQSSVDNRNDFILEPAKQEVLLNPGETDSRMIYVTSRINAPTNFKIEIEDIEGSDQPDKPVILLGNDKSPYSLKDYLHPEVSEFTLNFGERIGIPVSIDLPKNQAPGGFYAAVIVSNAPSKTASTTAQAAAETISRVASLFFVRINGPVNESGHLTDFTIKSPQVIYQKADLTFQIYFKNEGSVHLVPYGYIDIKNMWGATIDQLPVDAYFSLPQSLRYREIPWTRPVAIGRYTATLSLHRGYGDTIDTKTISFWIIPWRIIIITLLVILILVALIYFLLKNFEFKRKR